MPTLIAAAALAGIAEGALSGALLRRFWPSPWFLIYLLPPLGLIVATPFLGDGSALGSVLAVWAVYLTIACCFGLLPFLGSNADDDGDDGDDGDDDSEDGPEPPEPQWWPEFESRLDDWAQQSGPREREPLTSR